MMSLPYRTPIIRRALISEMVDNMRKERIVQPSMSPWASPIVFSAQARRGISLLCWFSLSQCCNQKDIISFTTYQRYTSKFFFFLDLASGYWQVELDAESYQKSAFTMYSGLFEFICMLFGLCNALAIFQCLMQKVLAGLEWCNCFVYLDDILVASVHLMSTYSISVKSLHNYEMCLKPCKCSLLRDSFPFLGHIISTESVRPDPAKSAVPPHLHWCYSSQTVLRIIEGSCLRLLKSVHGISELETLGLGSCVGSPILSPYLPLHCLHRPWRLLILNSARPPVSLLTGHLLFGSHY